ncbi:MAG: BatD family protein [Verrucomicrobia bacterium]|nr:BatD family protein [Verrucomicrobiota bacterium]
MKHIPTSCLGTLLLVAVLLFIPRSLKASSHPLTPRLSAVATLSCRGVKPGARVELVVTVRNALHPVIASVERPSSFRMRTLRKPRLLKTEEGDVWLFRYQIIPTETGDFEIPPITVTDASASTYTRTAPLILRVSLKGEAPVLTSGELARAVNLTSSLSEEVMKNAPQKAPKPDPAPSVADLRPLPTRIISSCWKELQAFWNYPGGN